MKIELIIIIDVFNIQEYARITLCDFVKFHGHKKLLFGVQIKM